LPVIPVFSTTRKLTRLGPDDSPVYALLRESAEGKDIALVLVNTDAEKANPFTLDVSAFRFPLSAFQFDLLSQPLPKFSQGKIESLLHSIPALVIASHQHQSLRV